MLQGSLFARLQETQGVASLPVSGLAPTFPQRSRKMLIIAKTMLSY